jgi:septal ring factor EnvC (AmiA/AmiB activator)
MRKDRHVPLKGILLAAASFAAVLAAGVTAHAQGGIRDVNRSERTMSALENEAAAKKRDQKTIMAEINEDFARLRAISEGFKSANSAAAQPNYKSISDDTAEVKKRAARLKKNLTGLPKPEKEEKRQKSDVPLDEAQMRALLSSFGELLSDFLNNPVFSDMGTLDTQLALKARRDLDGLIETCEIVKKGAEQLGKRTGR